MQDVEVHKKSVAWNTTPRLPNDLKGLQQVGVSLCQFTLQARAFARRQTSKADNSSWWQVVVYNQQVSASASA